MAYRCSPLSHTGLCTSIFCIILLFSPIPIPEFRQAIILLLCASFSSMICGDASTLEMLSPPVAIICAVSNLILYIASLVLTVVRWDKALAQAGEWEIPNNATITIPHDVNPELWLMVHGTRYGSAVVALAAVQFAGGLLSGVVGILLSVANQTVRLHNR
ncbi:hypothetical protein MAPG_05146 [Magnaporthiopsis poae ATCC 64411]|uniref:Uncharacterized protein n=1 Tax=Magnaporthiopsis poae (strain ATCC 64411 / 73-15) TaxID=644358 RepID=A0A0C4DYM0_MAGP6|nr:hypothetical protein MAPG_05146 [Magnaporthiopsis poae ATCC 64411]